MRLCVTFFALPLALFLSACGGGGGGSSSGDELVQGTLTGMRIEGLRYETPSGAGVLDNTQAFAFRNGERVTFKIGDTILGSPLGASSLDCSQFVDGLTLPTTEREARQALVSDTRLHRLANILRLLMMVDDDGDVDNGIQIPESLHSLLSSADLELDGPDYEIPISWRRLRRDALATGLWGGMGRPVPYATPALAALDAALGRRDVIGRWTRIDADDDNDGDVDRMFQRVYGNGVPGYQQRTNTDTDGNGSTNFSSSVEYNELGRTISRVRYDEAGVVTSRTTYSYDLNGEVVTEERDSNGDGSEISRTTTVRNDLGREIRIDWDRDSDGTMEKVMKYEYDSMGVLRISHQSNDPDDDGVENNSATRYYNEFEQQIRFESRGGSSPVIERVESSMYDARGLLVRTELDIGNDGSVDSTTTQTYDTNGYLTSRIRDTDNNGIPDYILEQTYNADGRRLSRHIDSDGDGDLDEWEVVVLDARGNVVRREEDGRNDDDGDADHVSYTTYDAYDQSTRREVDSDVDGVIDFVSVYHNTYSAAGWLILRETDLGDNGTIDKSTATTRERGTWWDLLS